MCGGSSPKPAPTPAPAPAPPPEITTGPVFDSDTQSEKTSMVAKQKGRKSLRIDLTDPANDAATGLNIPA